jgi:dienelactone hydrolase
MGKVVDLSQDVKAYVVRPPEGQANGYGIISIPDIYHFSAGRNKGFMDQFALGGYAVVHLDVAGDDCFGQDDSMDNFQEWVHKYPYPSVLKPKIKDVVIPYLKNELGATKIAALGFCWGCHVVIQMASDSDITSGNPPLTAAAMFHPSLQVNGMFGGHPESLDHAAKVTIPVVMVPTGNDPPFVGPEGSVLAKFRESSTRANESKSVPFPDMQHGFTIRGDGNDPNVKRDVQAAIQLALEFLNEKLA